MITLLLAASLWLPAVAGSMAADQLTTQQALRMGYVESNRLPGMSTLPGRTAWNVGQLAAIGAALRSKNPKWRKAGKIGAVVCIASHLGAAYLNSRTMWRHR